MAANKSHSHIPTNRPIRIYKSLSQKIVHDSNTIKLIALFSQLKSMYVGGIILNYTSRYKQLTAVLDISESTLRKRINQLTTMGLIKKEGKHISFIAHKKIKELFDLSPKLRKVNLFAFENTKQIQNKIIVTAINENLKQQKYKINKKILSQKIKRLAIQCSTIEENTYSFYAKRIDSLLENQIKRNLKTIKCGRIPKINTQATLSRQGVAKLLGRKSKATGTRWIRKLNQLNLILEHSLIFMMQ